MDANLNEQSQGRRGGRFEAKHGQAQQWDVIKLYPYDHTSLIFFLSFFFLLQNLLRFSPTVGVFALFYT